jgi:hypothetical protein
MSRRWLTLVGLVVLTGPSAAQAQIDTSSWFIAPRPVGVWRGASADGLVQMKLVLAPDGTFLAQTNTSAPVAGRWQWDATSYTAGYLRLNPPDRRSRSPWLEFSGLYRGGDDLVLSTLVGQFPNVALVQFRFQRQR